jgi:hypothetical protein
MKIQSAEPDINDRYMIPHAKYSAKKNHQIILFREAYTCCVLSCLPANYAVIFTFDLKGAMVVDCKYK